MLQEEDELERGRKEDPVEEAVEEHLDDGEEAVDNPAGDALRLAGGAVLQGLEGLEDWAQEACDAADEARAEHDE